jgi:hypothetical protein
MMKKPLASLFLFAGLLFLTLSSFVSAQVSIPNPLAVNNFCQLLTSIASAVGGLIAMLGTIMIIWSGILFLTSAGSTERTGAAKKALIYAIMGIVVGLLASAIVEIIKGVISANGGGC